MEAEEIRWLNNYHQEVYQKLRPHLNEEELIWLVEKCQVVEIE
jgi:Xaa-Pro aminopeptidase